MRGLVIALFLLASPAVWALQAKEPLRQANAPKQGTSADNRGTQQAPLVVHIQSVPPPTEEERAEKAEERKEKSHSDTWLVRLTGVLAVATLALVIATGFLWWSTRRLAVGAEDTAKRQLRAYVNADGITGVFDPKGGPFVANVVLRNFGQTPAYHVVGWVAIQAKSNDLQPTFPDASEDMPMAANILGPNQPTRFSIPTTDPVPANIRQLIVEGKGTIYVHGRIDYVDVFGIPHFTRYRMFLCGDGAAEGIFQPSTTGNETDDFPQST